MAEITQKIHRITNVIQFSEEGTIPLCKINQIPFGNLNICNSMALFWVNFKLTKINVKKMLNKFTGRHKRRAYPKSYRGGQECSGIFNKSISNNDTWKMYSRLL